jgi:hypothetical protein
MHSVGVFGVSQEGSAARPFGQAASAMLVRPVLLLPLHLQALLALLLRSVDRNLSLTYLISKEKKLHYIHYITACLIIHPLSPFLVEPDI